MATAASSADVTTAAAPSNPVSVAPESIPSAPAATTTVATVPAASPDVPASAASSPPGPTADLPDHGPAPELANDTWLNSDAPIRLADLRGKVVMVEFWTYG